MKLIENYILTRADKKPILLDYYDPKAVKKLPLLIFAHGYKGFKDWGAWELMGKAFANSGFCFLKFNFSHNGGTMQQPIDFPDLEAFGNNNYSKEVDDLNDVIQWSISNLSNNIDREQIYLLGHSRAGGITAIVASQNKRVKKLVTIGSVSDYETRFPTGIALEQWKNDGVYYIKNGRTYQEMPHYYQFYEDFKINKQQLQIKKAVTQLNIPHLIIHGENDEAVQLKEALQLHSWNRNSQLYIIKEANHTLGATHPWNKNILPTHLRQAVQCTVNFFKK